MIEKHMSFVRDSVSSLKAVGVQPIILLIPEKVDIYRDKLGAIQPPASREHYYAQIRAQLEALGDKVPDLRAAFLSARQADDIFLKTDTHWTVAGAGVGASEVAAILRADDALSHEAFTLASEPETEHSGDLLKFAKLPVFSHYVPLPVERIGPLSAKTTDANLDDLLAEEPAGP